MSAIGVACAVNQGRTACLVSRLRRAGSAQGQRGSWDEGCVLVHDNGRSLVSHCCRELRNSDFNNSVAIRNQATLSMLRG